MSKTALDILKHYWDYHSFRPLQQDIIDHVLNGENAFVLLPTGGGKSMCYQIPGLAKPGTCLVISPLIALMHDQVQSLNKKGIKALALTSQLRYEDLMRELDNCIYGHYKFIYISPEKLHSDLVIARFNQIQINLIAIDEAHCISQWGHDFRPSYSKIYEALIQLPKAPVIALTGSANKKVVNDISKQLNIGNVKVFKQSFRRPNLAYMTIKTFDKLNKIERILKKNKQSSIVYVRSRRKTIEIHDKLISMGFTASFFHGGLTHKEKAEQFNSWIHNHSQVMVATNAFGMGIDKSDVKTVIHFNIPDSIENYYQEAGRAGRNGEKAFAILLYNDQDFNLLKTQFISHLPTVKEVKFIFRKLFSYLNIPYQTGEMSTHDFNFNQFSTQYNIPANTLNYTLKFLEQQNILILNQHYKSTLEILFLVDGSSLLKYSNTQHQNLINYLLRHYGISQNLKLSLLLSEVSSKLNLPSEEIKTLFQDLEHQQLLELKIRESDLSITFIEPREDDKTINRVSKHLVNQNKLKTNHINAIIQFINADSCKENLMLQYFGENNTEPCGKCSFCLEDKILKSSDQSNIITQIKYSLQKQPKSSIEICNEIDESETKVLKCLRLLLDHNVLRLTVNQKYTLNYNS